LKNFVINHENWDSLAVDRQSWRRLSYDGAIAIEIPLQSPQFRKDCNTAISACGVYPRNSCRDYSMVSRYVFCDALHDGNLSVLSMKGTTTEQDLFEFA
jgi:hypothetical protein